MKVLSLQAVFVLSALLCSPAWAAYPFYLTDNLTSINSSNWAQAGSVVATSSGLTAPDANGGSLISQVAIPDGSSDGEVRATIALTASGGTYTLFTRATPDARTGGGGSGTFYAFEMQNPTFSNGNCSATYVVYKRFSATMTALASWTGGCANGMTLRLVVGPGLLVYWSNQTYPVDVLDSDISSGQLGVGAYGSPAGNSISLVQLGPRDLVAPSPINPQTVGTAAFPNRVEFHWQGVTDDSNGVGLCCYSILRNGVAIGASTTPDYTDEAAAPGTAYTYSIAAIDQHNNLSAWVNTTVTTPPAGTTEPRRIGVRPTGSYWGAAGEQIDLNSGNLNFSVPLLKVQSRGGWSVTFALSYNSQNWRQDSGGTWDLGRDVGYGYGWTLEAGSIRPVWYGWWTLDHYVYVDATGAEYRLDQNNGGVWTSQQGVYVSFDSNTAKLYFPDGSFWLMGAQSAGNEQDAGSMYPTLIQDTNGNQLS
jgi:hypothetical protein